MGDPSYSLKSLVLPCISKNSKAATAVLRIKQAKPREKPYKISDEKGLYLEVAPNGGKWWRIKYRHDGKEKRLSLGVYPDVSLAQARERRDDARKLIASGVDPSSHRKAVKLARAESNANSFEVVAREWFEKWKATKSENHSDKVIRRLERDVFPWLGARPIADVKPVELLSVLRRIEERVVETAHRAKQNCGQVFRYAVATGRAERDITVDLSGSLTPWCYRRPKSVEFWRRRMVAREVNWGHCGPH